METNRDAIIAHLEDEIVGARKEQYDLTTLIQRRNNLKGKYRDMVEDIENQKVQISESLIDIDKNIKQASSKRDVVEEDIKAFEDLYRRLTYLRRTQPDIDLESFRKQHEAMKGSLKGAGYGVPLTYKGKERKHLSIEEAQVLATINMYEAIHCRVDEKEVRAKCSEYAKDIVAQGNPYHLQTGIKSIKGKLKGYLVKDIKHTVDAQGLVAVLRSDWVRHLPVEAPTYHVGDKDKEGLEDVYRRDKLYNLPKYAQVSFLDLYDTIPDEIFTYLGVMTDMLRGEQMVKVRSDKRGAFNIHRSTFINQARIVTDQEQESKQKETKRNKLYYLSKGTKIKDSDGKVYTYEGVVNRVLDGEIIRIRTASNTVTTMYRDIFINGDYQILEYRMSNGKHKNNSVDRLKLINMNIGSKVTLPNRDGTDTPPLVYTYQGSTTTPSGTEAVILYTPTGRTQVMRRLEFINEALLISEVKEENKKKDNKHINNSTDMLKLIDIKVDDRVTLPNRDGEQSSIIYRYIGKVDYDGYIIVRLRNAVGRVVQVRREQFIEEARIQGDNTKRIRT